MLRYQRLKHYTSGIALRHAHAMSEKNDTVTLLSPILLEDKEHPVRHWHISYAGWQVLNRLRASGYATYVVGGVVRDALLGHVPSDVDISTSARPEDVAKIFPGSKVVGRRFPHCLVPIGETMIEIGSFDHQFHTHQHALMKHRPYWRGLHRSWSQLRWTDARRRDFTVNGLLYEPFSQVVFDYVGGIEDCRNRVLRTIAEPSVSFSEDPIRMLRGIGLAAKRNLTLDASCRRAMLECAQMLRTCSKDRLQKEIDSMFRFGHAAKSFELLKSCGTLQYVLPHHDDFLISKDTPTDLAKSLWDVLSQMDKRAEDENDPLDGGFVLACISAPLVSMMSRIRGDYSKCVEYVLDEMYKYRAVRPMKSPFGQKVAQSAKDMLHKAAKSRQTNDREVSMLLEILKRCRLTCHNDC